MHGKGLRRSEPACLEICIIQLGIYRDPHLSVYALVKSEPACLEIRTFQPTQENVVNRINYAHSRLRDLYTLASIIQYLSFNNQVYHIIMGIPVIATCSPTQNVLDRMHMHVTVYVLTLRYNFVLRRAAQ